MRAGGRIGKDAQQKVPTMLGLVLKDRETQGDMLSPGDPASQKPGQSSNRSHARAAPSSPCSHRTFAEDHWQPG